MAAMRGVIGKILKQGDGPRARSFAVAIYEKTGGDLTEVKIGGRLGSLREGDFFSAEGDWRSNEYKGKTQYVFNASSMRPDLPKTKAGTVAWLRAILPSSETGLDLEGLRRAVKSDDAIEGILNDPTGLIEQSRSPEKYGDRIRSLLSKRTSSKQATDLMQSAKLDKRAINSVLSAFKGAAYQTIKENPYDIMSVPAIQFESADRLGKHLGVSKSDNRRILGAVSEFLRQAENAGSSAIMLNDAVRKVADWFNLEEEPVKDAIMSGLKKPGPGSILPLQIPGQPDVHLMSEACYRAEVAASSCLLEMLENGRKNDPDAVAAAAEEVFEGTKLDEHQRKAVKIAATHPVSIITGGPGTGKSTILEKLIEVSKRVEDCDIIVTAPTGKAAKRAEEVTGDTGQTLQMLLGQQYNEENGATEFKYNRQNPLPAKSVVVVDEVSMMDNTLLAALFAAMPPDGRIILQGDQFQLASVGVGRVLADLMEMNIDGKSLVPIGELINTYRQDPESKITDDAKKINAGEIPNVDNTLRGGVRFKECSSRDITDEVVSMIRHQFVAKGINPTRDIAVIAPQAPGYGGTWEINQALSKELNPDGESIPGIERGRYDDERMPLPRVGDRVMLTENDHDNHVMNGDIGFIKGHREDPERKGGHLMEVEYDDGRIVEMRTTKWRDVMLAYAITCHKSQGSQYPIVIMPFSEMHEGMADRSLVYTGWTRAKNMVVGLGSKETFGKFITSTKSQDRYTAMRAMTEYMAFQRDMKPLGEAREALPLPTPIKIDRMMSRLKTPEKAVVAGPKKRLLSSLAKPVATAKSEPDEAASKAPTSVSRAKPVVSPRRPMVPRRMPEGSSSESSENEVRPTSTVKRAKPVVAGRRAIVAKAATKPEEKAQADRETPRAQTKPAPAPQPKTPVQKSPALKLRPRLAPRAKREVNKEEAPVAQPTMKL